MVVQFFPTGSIVAAIEQLGNRISGLFNSAIKQWNDQNYQPDKNLPATAQANTATAQNQPTVDKASQPNNTLKTPSEIVQANANKSTQTKISLKV